MNEWENLATGNSGNIELEKAWLRKAKEVYELFCMKQRDYGSGNIATGGEKGVALRVGDKVSRLFNITGIYDSIEKPTNFEARRDTWIDLADYGLIGLMVVDNEWPSLTAGEAYGKEAIIRILKEME